MDGQVEVDRRRFGDQGEDATVQFLEARGYAIRSRNFRCRYGELDVVAEKDGTICFVEVRARATAIWGDPSYTVSRSKQRRIVKAALHYMLAYGVRGKMIRFDVVSIVGRGRDAAIEHYPNAFDAGM
ncbi:MAG TPA: YraN family protein [Myxococcaceae bacterium]|nr:YraN family protein [Myxococcaceae bacterium]